MMVSPYQIKYEYGHYVVRDARKQIVLTGDTQREVEDDLIELLAQKYRGEELIAANM